MIKNELVSKVRPEARWSYYSQDYKSPNGLKNKDKLLWLAHVEVNLLQYIFKLTGNP